MHKTTEKVERLCDMNKKLVGYVECEMSKGMECFPTEEGGQAIDMIKDLAQAEKDLWKACYYHKIVEAMEEAKEEDEMMDRMGYDRYRYSSGRYAPKGHGHEVSAAKAMGRAGFIPWPPLYGPDGKPIMPDFPEYADGHQPHMDRMGYPGDGMTDQYRRDKHPDDMGTRSNSPWDRYQTARRHYTETRTPESKAEMTEEAKKYLQESVDTLRDIWVEADPDLQQKMKKDLLALMREMGM